MYEEIAKLLYEYSKTNRMADKNFVNKVIQLVSLEYGLDDYIKDKKIIVSRSDDRCEFGSAYNMGSMDLVIDLVSIMRSYYYENVFYSNKVLLFNTGVVLTIFHELDHTRLNKSILLKEDNIMTHFMGILLDFETPDILELSSEEIDKLSDEEKKMLIKKFGSSMGGLLKKNILYQIMHDRAPHERRANINSYRALNHTLDLLNNDSLVDLDKIKLKNLKDLIKKSRCGYRSDGIITNSPSYDYLCLVGEGSKLPKLDVYDEDRMLAYKKAKNRYSFQDRVLNGLPLSDCELEEINKNANHSYIYRKKR